jgi:hypothetical protein
MLSEGIKKSQRQLAISLSITILSNNIFEITRRMLTAAVAQDSAA